jgi:outer membrane biogenesis lipoprotein LolB
MKPCLRLQHYLLVLSCWLLAAGAAQAQVPPGLSAAQLRQALRQHPQADRYRVDLLNELADE